MSGEARREQVTAFRAFRISSHAADPYDDDKLRSYHGRVVLGVGPSPARASLLHPSLAVCVCVCVRARSSATFAHFPFTVAPRSPCASQVSWRYE